jgi:hypothetical protein
LWTLKNVKAKLRFGEKTLDSFIGDVPTSDSPNQIIQSESRTSSAEAPCDHPHQLRIYAQQSSEGISKTIFSDFHFS